MAAHGDDLRKAWQEELEQLIGEIQPFEGAHELMAEVKRRGFRLVLASSGKTQHVEAFLDLIDGKSLADAWTTSDDVAKSKPEDIDFLVSDQQSYRQLRQIVRNSGLDALATRELGVMRAPSVDGYGIRTAILVAGVAIKFEISHEGRIDLDTPSPDHEICGVRTLTPTDQVASKLLANDDRWEDTSMFSRDLIDLAMMKPDVPTLKAGARKAVDAYGKTVGESFNKAITALQERPHRLDASISALKMEAPRAAVWQSIRDLSARWAKVDELHR